jgi:CDP-6-deoxy-D-xylo-4-hexulose-3-dehydrase
MKRWTGCFVYIAWPHPDQEKESGEGFATKNRPALVITEPDPRGDVQLLKVTSTPFYEDAVPFSQSDLLSGVLRKPGFIRTDRFLTVHQTQLKDWGARLSERKLQECHRALALRHSRRFSNYAHTAQRPDGDPKRAAFRPGIDVVPYAGRVFDEEEVAAAVSTTLDFWLTLGKEGEAFESELADFLGVRRSILTNSGSSANLLAFSALTSHKLPPEKRIRPGDEVITCAAGFPTTVAPILQNGAVPVFLDNNPVTGNADLSRLEDAFVPGKTKAVMMAHALGNPFDLATVLAFCRKHDLWLIEDNCDALGCTYSLPVELARSLGLHHLLQRAEARGHEHAYPRISDGMLTAYTGTFGDLSTQSFYPPHHLTMGEGGAINIVKDMKLKVLVESFRDWGRDCWCASGVDNTCKKRFGWQLGELPEGYDHKYIYSHLGYNLKPLDPQAAIGRAQLKKMPAFIEARKRNWQLLRSGLADLEDVFEFALPTHATGWNRDGTFTWDGSGFRTGCSWFGFLMLVRPEAPFTRSEFVRHLDEKKIGNRMLFGGNLVRQPAFVQLRKDNPHAFRVVQSNAASKAQNLRHGTDGQLPGADRIMNQAVFIGVYPGLTREMIDYMVNVIRDFAAHRRSSATQALAAS